MIFRIVARFDRQTDTGWLSLFARTRCFAPLYLPFKWQADRPPPAPVDTTLALVEIFLL